MPEQELEPKQRFFRLQGRTIRIMGRSVDLPASRMARIAIGVLLILGGCFSILPVLGIWMLPLGFMVLSIDIAIVRRGRRRMEVRWSRWRAARRAGKAAFGDANVDGRGLAERQTIMSGHQSRPASSEPIS